MSYDGISRRRLIGIATGAIPFLPLLANSEPGRQNERRQDRSPWLVLPPTPSLPTPSKKGLLNINGTSIFFAQFGAGPPVLLLHGGLANSSYWGLQIETLSRQFLVTVMDTRGHGRSPLATNSFSYDLFARDVVELLKQLEISRTALVGWSDGAITGIVLALTTPNLISSLFAFGANTTLSGLKPGGARTGIFSQYTARCSTEYKMLSPRPELWPALKSGLNVMWKSEPNISKQVLSTIRTPVAIVDGEKDEIIKLEHTKEIADSIPKAKLSILPGTSHFAMLQDPAQFNADLTSFLVEQT